MTQEAKKKEEKNEVEEKEEGLLVKCMLFVL